MLSGPFKLTSISHLLKLDVNALLQYYDAWGPSAQICIMLTQGQLSVEEHAYRIIFVSDPDLFLDKLNMSELSSTLFALQPLAESRSEFIAQVPINHLKGVIALAVAKRNAVQRSVFFNRPPRIAGQRQVRRGFSRFLYTFDWVMIL